MFVVSPSACLFSTGKMHTMAVFTCCTDLCPRHWPVELWDDLAHSFGRAGGGGDDVLVGPTAVPPRLGTGPVHGLLGGRVRMHRGLYIRERERERERCVMYSNPDVTCVGLYFVLSLIIVMLCYPFSCPVWHLLHSEPTNRSLPQLYWVHNANFLSHF